MKTLEEARHAFRNTDHTALKALKPGDVNSPNFAGLRSVVWKEALLFQDVDRSGWIPRLDESRSAYNALHMHFMRAIEHPDELGSATDPLADSEESPWNSLRRDEAIRAEIFQDVERCMPENVYFRQPSTQNMLMDVLFIFCKLNQDVGYRQGMHELLAPIVWVIERDALNTKLWKTRARNVDEDSLIFSLLDQRFVEHDAFTLFCLIMQNAKVFYEPGAEQPKVPERRPSTETDVPILRRINRIYHRYLPEVDPELSAHLISLDVVPQVFLMKWMRLLFGREFPLDRTMEVWDLLLTIDPNLDLVDYICVAMLIRIRWKLLSADANQALILLIHYPEPEQSSPPWTLVQDALFLKEKLDPSGGAHVIEKRTGRRPTSTSGMLRPSTPPPAGRKLPVSPLRFPSVIGTTPMGFEGLLSEAARAAYSRGEKWGFNRAVRDAVGEVRKNVSVIGTSPRNSLHRRSSSADLIRRCEKLEQRNKALAQMLENALGELWECQRMFAEQPVHQVIEDKETSQTAGESDLTPEKSAGQQSVDALSIAIAKVQFVQVYLNDGSMPLPVEEAEAIAAQTDASSNNKEAALSGSGTQDGTRVANASSTDVRPITPLPDATPDEKINPTSTSTAITSSDVIFDDTNDHEKQKPEGLSQTLTSDDPKAFQSQLKASTSATTAPPTSATQSTTAPAAYSKTSQPSPPTSNRPSLEQSSFSWMLGHKASDRHHAFAAALSSPFGSDDSGGPGGRRTVDKGKAFLFGDNDDDSDSDRRQGTGDGGVEVSGSEAGASRGKRRSVLRKKPPGTGSSSSKGTGKMGEQAVEEDISLTAMK